MRPSCSIWFDKTSTSPFPARVIPTSLNADDQPLCLMPTRSNKHFLTISFSLTCLTELSLGNNNRSSLFTSLPRTPEISEFLNTVAAERETVFRKKDRSRARIARFTGGRNILEVSLRGGLRFFVAASMGEPFGACECPSQ